MKSADLIWQTAIVRHGEDGDWLEFSDPGACSRCSRGTGCGAALFSRLFARPDTRLRLPAGDRIPADRLVRVGLNPRWFMLVAAASYLLPVFAFVVGAVLADQVVPGSDPAAAFSGLSLALASGLLARYRLESMGRPHLELVDLHENLESARHSVHFPEQGA